VSSLGLFLALISALAWTVFDATRKGLARKVPPSALGVWLPLAQAPLLMLWALSRGPALIPRASLWPMAGSVILSVAGLLGFLQALRRSPMSLTVPLLSFTPILATLLAWLFRNQTPTLQQGLGVGMVLLGATVLGMKSAQWPGLRAYAKDTGVRCMAGAAVAWSITSILDQMALERGAGAWYAPYLSLAVGLSLMAALLLFHQGSVLTGALRTLKGLPGLALAALLMGAAALALQLEALRVAPVGFVEVIKRGIGMSGAILFGRLFFLEPINSHKIAAAVIMTAGVGLVVLGA
jgi:drug/metabolite transporter (DMT)-like permease